jgi:hypothetical protein
LVLAAGVPEEWIAEGVSVKGMPTPWGLLDYSLTSEGNSVRLRVGGGLQVPPGGIVFRGMVIRKLPTEVLVKR